MSTKTIESYLATREFAITRIGDVVQEDMTLDALALLQSFQFTTFQHLLRVMRGNMREHQPKRDHTLAWLDRDSPLAHSLPMPRRIRIEYPRAIYHVMSRGDRRENICHDDMGLRDFLKTLAETCQKTSFEVNAYCLMRNHFHLVVGLGTQFSPCNRRPLRYARSSRRCNTTKASNAAYLLGCAKRWPI